MSMDELLALIYQAELQEMKQVYLLDEDGGLTEKGFDWLRILKERAPIENDPRLAEALKKAHQ